MAIFDLVLIASVLLSIAMLAVAAALAIAGRFGPAWRILRAWGIAAAVYFGIVVIVSVFTRPRVLAIGEDACFDDWCIAVEHVEKAQTAASQTYSITFRLSSRARGVSQRERNVVAYLRDARGERHDAHLASDDEPFDVLLDPSQSIRTVRVFDLPPEAAHPQLVIAHEGGFPIAWFIIGQGPFHKAIVVPMQ